MDALGAGSTFLSAIMAYGADKTKAKAQRAWQQYTNKMVDLSDTLNQNVITANQLFTADAFSKEALNIQAAGLLTVSQEEASAAAAGVKGNSVSRVMHSILGNAATKESERQDAFKQAMMGFQQQRQNSVMEAAMQKDHSYIPKPNLTSYLVSAASSAASSGFF